MDHLDGLRSIMGAGQHGFDGDELEGTLDDRGRGHLEYHGLVSPIHGLRAIEEDVDDAGVDEIIEQAKGILMERNGIGADAAFALLKSHSQGTGRRLFDVAEALTQSHQLLPSVRRGEKAQAE